MNAGTGSELSKLSDGREHDPQMPIDFLQSSVHKETSQSGPKVTNESSNSSKGRNVRIEGSNCGIRSLNEYQDNFFQKKPENTSKASVMSKDSSKEAWTVAQKKDHGSGQSYVGMGLTKGNHEGLTVKAETSAEIYYGGAIVPLQPPCPRICGGAIAPLPPPCPPICGGAIEPLPPPCPPICGGAIAPLPPQCPPICGGAIAPLPPPCPPICGGAIAPLPPQCHRQILV